MWPAFWKKHCESILEVGTGETSRVEEMRRNFSAFAKYPFSALRDGTRRGSSYRCYGCKWLLLGAFLETGSVGLPS